MPRPIPCPKRTQLRPSQRCTSLASLPRSKLSWEICAGWVHDQLWQKPLWKETQEVRVGTGLSSRAKRDWHCSSLRQTEPLQDSARVDYPGAVSENDGGSFPPLEPRENYLSHSGPVAQLGARFHGMEEVVGSIPTRSTNYFQELGEPSTASAFSSNPSSD